MLRRRIINNNETQTAGDANERLDRKALSLNLVKREQETSEITQRSLSEVDMYFDALEKVVIEKKPIIVELESLLSNYKEYVENISPLVNNLYGDSYYKEIIAFIDAFEIPIKKAIEMQDDKKLQQFLELANCYYTYMGRPHWFLWVYRDPFSVSAFRASLVTFEKKITSTPYMRYNDNDARKPKIIENTRNGTKNVVSNQYKETKRYYSDLEQRIELLENNEIYQRLEEERQATEKVNQHLSGRMDQLEQNMTTVLECLNIYKQYDEEVDSLVCPITQQEMSDPVIAEDGHTYERQAIRGWLANHNTSPMTRKVIGGSLRTNWAVKSLIGELNDRRNEVKTNINQLTNRNRLFTRRPAQIEQQQEMAASASAQNLI